MSFEEKMHWSSLVAIVAGYGWYFWQTFMVASDGDAYIGRLLLVTIIITVVIIASAIFFAIQNRDDLGIISDERERTYELVAMRTGYFVLSFGVLGLFITAYFGLNLFTLLNLMFAVYVLSEVARISHQLYLLKQG